MKSYLPGDIATLWGLAAVLDANGDGRQDVLVPMNEGDGVFSWLILQSTGATGDGTFHVVESGIPFDAELSQQGATISNRVHAHGIFAMPSHRACFVEKMKGSDDRVALLRDGHDQARTRVGGGMGFLARFRERGRAFVATPPIAPWRAQARWPSTIYPPLMDSTGKECP